MFCRQRFTTRIREFFRLSVQVIDVLTVVLCRSCFVFLVSSKISDNRHIFRDNQRPRLRELTGVNRLQHRFQRVAWPDVVLRLKRLRFERQGSVPEGRLPELS